MQLLPTQRMVVVACEVERLFLLQIRRLQKPLCVQKKAGNLYVLDPTQIGRCLVASAYYKLCQGLGTRNLIYSPCHVCLSFEKFYRTVYCKHQQRPCLESPCLESREQVLLSPISRCIYCDANACVFAQMLQWQGRLRLPVRLLVPIL